jgi:hypothetical protein
VPELTPGTYSVSAVNVTASGHVWSPSPNSQDVPVVAHTETPASVQYAVTTGALTITVTGLPAAEPAALTVSGPSGFSQNVSGTTTMSGLAPGSYTLTAAPVSSGGSTWTPSSPRTTRGERRCDGRGSVALEQRWRRRFVNLRIDGL